MKSHRMIETLVGVFILLLALGALALGWRQRPGAAGDGYDLFADFSDASGIQAGTLVEIAGVPIGRVTQVRLSESYFARVQMRIEAGVKIPEEAELAWRQSDLLGAPRLSVLIFDIGDSYLMDGDFFSSVDPADNFFDVLSNLAQGNNQDG